MHRFSEQTNDVYDTNGGTNPAYTFLTGHGGFLQCEWIYYLRWLCDPTCHQDTYTRVYRISVSLELILCAYTNIQFSMLIITRTRLKLLAWSRASHSTHQLYYQRNEMARIGVWYHPRNERNNYCEARGHNRNCACGDRLQQRDGRKLVCVIPTLLPVIFWLTVDQYTESRGITSRSNTSYKRHHRSGKPCPMQACYCNRYDVYHP